MERMLDTGTEGFGGLMPEAPKPQAGVGTGFFINDEGYIVTHAHVVKDTKTLTIYYWDPLEYGDTDCRHG